MKKLFLLLVIFSSMLKIFGQNVNTKIENKFNKTKSKIYPVIKVLESKNDQVDIQLRTESAPVFRKIVEGVICLYGVDQENRFQILLERDLPESMSIEQLDKIASENLLDYVSDKTQIHQSETGAIGFTCGGQFEAALITVPEFWIMVEERLGEDVVFAIPSKDVILYVSADNESGILWLKNMVKKVFENGESLLSDKLYRYNNGQIQPLN